MTNTLQYIKAKFKPFIIRHFLSYDTNQFVLTLRRLGIRQGDALMIHASWLPQNGFRGRPVEMIQALKDTVGSEGLLSMPSLTYHNENSKAFLACGIPMNICRSPSRMGLLSEVFRRNREVRRSLSPTHPVSAWGAKSQWFVANHERALIPFGKDTPFAKLLELDGKILTIDASFSSITFTHFLEDRIAQTLPFPLYEPEPMTGIVIDYESKRHEVEVRVISEIANQFRREERLIAALTKARALQHARVGNTRLRLISCKAMTECVDRMIVSGQSFFEAPN